MKKLFAWVLLFVSAGVWAAGVGLFVVANNPAEEGASGTWSAGTLDLLSVLDPNALETDSQSKNVVNSWSGGAFDDDRNRLYIFGGGHGDSANNSLTAYDMDDNSLTTLSEFTSEPPCYDSVLSNTYRLSGVSGTFQAGETIINDTQANNVGTACSEVATATVRVTDTSGLHLFIDPETNIASVGDSIRGQTSGATATIAADDSACIGEYPPGEPTSRHSYGGLAYIPASGARTDDFVFMTGGSVACGSGGFARDVWLFNLTTNTWADKGKFASLPNAQARCTYDTTDDGVYCVYGPSDIGQLHFFDPDDDTFTAVDTNLGALDIDGKGNAVIVDRDVWLVAGGEVIKVNLDTPAASTVSVTGDTDILQGARRPGMAWDPHRHALAIWDNGENNTPSVDPCSIVELDIEASTLTELANAGCGITRNTSSKGVFGRFGYSKDLRQFIAVFDAGDVAYEYTTAPLTYTFTQKTWAAVDNFPCDKPTQGECKHIRLAEDSTDGLIYVLGGDHTPSDGPGQLSGQSGRNEMYTYNTQTAQFDEVTPDCGNGSLFPTGQDESGFAYDSGRDVFWYMLGFRFRDGEECAVFSGTADAGSTGSTVLVDAAATFITDGVTTNHFVQNENNVNISLIVSVDSETQLTTTDNGDAGNAWSGADYHVSYGVEKEVMKYDPNTNTWELQEGVQDAITDALGGGAGDWAHAVVDAVTGYVYIHNDKTFRRWDPTDPLVIGPAITAGDSMNTSMRDSQPVVAGRKAYQIATCDPDDPDFLRIFDMATETFSEGAAPQEPASCPGAGGRDFHPIYWSSKDKIIWVDINDENVNVYHIETDEWDNSVDHTFSPSAPGTFRPRHAAYDSVNDVGVFFGNSTFATDLFHLDITRN